MGDWLGTCAPAVLLVPRRLSGLDLPYLEVAWDECTIRVWIQLTSCGVHVFMYPCIVTKCIALELILEGLDTIGLVFA